jgi:hypothetical protein
MYPPREVDERKIEIVWGQSPLLTITLIEVQINSIIQQVLSKKKIK